MNSIVILRDKGWYAETLIQDGTERDGPFHNLDEALKSCKTCEWIMNGNKIKKKNIPLFKEVDVVVKKLVPLDAWDKSLWKEDK